MDSLSIHSASGPAASAVGAGQRSGARPRSNAPGDAISGTPAAPSDYYLTFRFSGDGAPDRRERLLRLLKEKSEERSWWDETGAFVLFQSRLGIEAIRALVETVVAERDFVLIGMVYVMRWELIGSAEDKSMFRVLRHTDGLA